jgi:hypothetical protein
MTHEPLILLHEESLRMTHPVFHVAPLNTKVIYVWDDTYVQHSAYSLKRLIFIYETLCAMDVAILHGVTLNVLQEINCSKVYIPYTNNLLLLNLIDSIRKVFQVEIVADEPFVNIKKPIEFKRFFQYWSKAEKTAFLQDGSLDA